MYIFHNGRVVAEKAILPGAAVLVDGERVAAIISEAEIASYPAAELIDAQGGYISPGFIDIHSDFIEGIVSPRPTTLMDVETGLREAEKILIGNGITTMFHSLSFYREDVFSHKPMRIPENVQKLVDAIHETHGRPHLIRHRLHARFEIDNLGETERLLKNIADGKVHLLSFMDHTPGQGQYRCLEVYRETLRGYRDVTNEEVDSIISDRQNSIIMTMEQMKEIADFARVRGIAVASHDDDNLQKIDLVKAIGTTISEFPITLEVAQKAQDCGLKTIVGAPNVMLGGSHSGNLSAVDAILHGCADILCSDYYPSALLHAVFALHEKYGQDLLEMFNMVTLNPAQAVNMDSEIGSISPGKKADLLVIEKMADGYPMITKTMVNGKLLTQTNYRTNAYAEEVR